MAIDPRDAFKNWLEAYVREVTRKQLGYTEGEMNDAAQFLAIPTDHREPHCAACGLVYDEPMHAWEHRCTATEPNPPLLTVATMRTMRAQLLGEGYNGRCDDLTYSDYAFLYDVGISLDNPTGDSL